jgi:hypothetical protein
VYLPCAGAGIVAVRATASPPGLRLLWRSATGGGPPIVAGGLVWTISQAGWLYGLDPRTGHVRRRATLNGPSGAQSNHFPTSSVGAGLLLAPAGNRVVAFRVGPSSSPAGTAPASHAPSGHATSGHHSRGSLPGGDASTTGLSGGAIAGIVAGSLLVLTGVGWLVWRRTPNRP